MVIPMETIAAKITSKLLTEMDGLIKEGWYSNRSEVIRDAIRNLIERKKLVRLETAIEEDVEWGLYGK